MGRLLNWGHWLIGGIFLAFGFLTLLSMGFGLVTATRRAFIDVFADAFGAAVALVCCWGILKWRRWGHYLALYLCITAFVAFALGIYFTRGNSFGVVLASAEGVTSLMLAWLLLPSVRAKYSGKTVRA